MHKLLKKLTGISRVFKERLVIVLFGHQNVICLHYQYVSSDSKGMCVKGASFESNKTSFIIILHFPTRYGVLNDILVLLKAESQRRHVCVIVCLACAIYANAKRRLVIRLRVCILHRRLGRYMYSTQIFI